MVINSYDTEDEARKAKEKLRKNPCINEYNPVRLGYIRINHDKYYLDEKSYEYIKNIHTVLSYLLLGDVSDHKKFKLYNASDMELFYENKNEKNYFLRQYIARNISGLTYIKLEYYNNLNLFI